MEYGIVIGFLLAVLVFEAPQEGPIFLLFRSLGRYLSAHTHHLCFLTLAISQISTSLNLLLMIHSMLMDQPERYASARRRALASLLASLCCLAFESLLP